MNLKGGGELEKIPKKFLPQVFKITTEKFSVVYGNCTISIFLKKISNQFFLSPLCSTVLKKNLTKKTAAH